MHGAVLHFDMDSRYARIKKICAQLLALGEFVNFYYNSFDTNRQGLAGLYVCSASLSFSKVLINK